MSFTATASPATSAKGRTLVVVGVGNIGHEVCMVGRALGMKVIGVDRDPRHADIEYADLANALGRADVVVCAMDLNPTTRGYFDAAKWRLVKRGALFVNISRGEISPATALLAALEAGQLGGVGIDVYDHEAELAVALRGSAGPTVCLDAPPTPADHDARQVALASGKSLHPEVHAALELARRDDAICTPHNAFNSFEGVERKCLHSVQQVTAFLRTGQVSVARQGRQLARPLILPIPCPDREGAPRSASASDLTAFGSAGQPPLAACSRTPSPGDLESRVPALARRAASIELPHAAQANRR